ncbi:MAG: RCC1 domain-containing protein [Planctomycetota bacterium]|nr:RCC1 domain-containing protein [Planctomycetota bacterium]
MNRTAGYCVRAMLVAAIAICLGACPGGGGKGNGGSGSALSLDVRAWGWNEYGQLGDGMNSTISSTPVQMVDTSDPTGFLTGVIAVAAGLDYTVGLP